MKITPKILSIPPYISTHWENIQSICLQTIEEKPYINLHLKDGSKIQIPDLSESEIDEIFFAHVNFAESEKEFFSSKNDSISFAIPFPSDISPAEMISSNLQHNPEQSHLPPIPVHILSKITKMIGSLKLTENPFDEQPVAGCNCIYCQLASNANPESQEEEVTDEDLTFRDWIIIQKENSLYHVENPLDNNETYNVYLGEPIGCTCGCKNCEHIKAVLNT